MSDLREEKKLAVGSSTQRFFSEGSHRFESSTNLFKQDIRTMLHASKLFPPTRATNDSKSLTQNELILNILEKNQKSQFSNLAVEPTSDNSHQNPHFRAQLVSDDFTMTKLKAIGQDLLYTKRDPYKFFKAPRLRGGSTVETTPSGMDSDDPVFVPSARAETGQPLSQDAINFEEIRVKFVDFQFSVQEMNKIQTLFRLDDDWIRQNSRRLHALMSANNAVERIMRVDNLVDFLASAHFSCSIPDVGLSHGENTSGYRQACSVIVLAQALAVRLDRKTISEVSRGRFSIATKEKAVEMLSILGRLQTQLDHAHEARDSIGHFCDWLKTRLEPGCTEPFDVTRSFDGNFLFGASFPPTDNDPILLPLISYFQRIEGRYHFVAHSFRPNDDPSPSMPLQELCATLAYTCLVGCDLHHYFMICAGLEFSEAAIRAALKAAVLRLVRMDEQDESTTGNAKTISWIVDASAPPPTSCTCVTVSGIAKMILEYHNRPGALQDPAAAFGEKVREAAQLVSINLDLPSIMTAIRAGPAYVGGDDALAATTLVISLPDSITIGSQADSVTLPRLATVTTPTITFGPNKVSSLLVFQFEVERVFGNGTRVAAAIRNVSNVGGVMEVQRRAIQMYLQKRGKPGFFSVVGAVVNHSVPINKAPTLLAEPVLLITTADPEAMTWIRSVLGVSELGTVTQLTVRGIQHEVWPTVKAMHQQPLRYPKYTTTFTLTIKLVPTALSMLETVKRLLLSIGAEKNIILAVAKCTGSVVNSRGVNTPALISTLYVLLNTSDHDLGAVSFRSLSQNPLNTGITFSTGPDIPGRLSQHRKETAAIFAKVGGPSKTPQSAPAPAPGVVSKSRKPKMSKKKTGKIDPPSQEPPVTTSQAVAGLRQVQDSFAQLALAQAAQAEKTRALEIALAEQAEQARADKQAAEIAQAARDEQARADQAARDEQARIDRQLNDARADRVEAILASVANTLAVLSSGHSSSDRKRQATGDGQDMNTDSAV